MSIPEDTQLISKYAAPHQKTYLDDDYISYRTIISFSSFRSRHGQVLIGDAIEPTKELGIKFLKKIKDKVASRKKYLDEISMMMILGRPLYWVDKSKFDFTDSNNGHYIEGITTVPRICGTENAIQNLFNSINTSAEMPVIVEKVHVKEITHRMPSAADYILRRFKQSPFRHSDIIYLRSHDLNI